ncbi:MAG: PKD domain-containing protein, partial [Flavobacteriales bacterium]
MFRRGLFLFLPLTFLVGLQVFGQSDNCNTATSLNFTDSTCVNGTTSGATSNNTMYCNPNPVVEVWYTYTVQGSNNQFTVNPGSMTDPMIVIDGDGCSNGTYDDCVTATGSNSASTSWGYTPGTQVYIGVASNGGTDGSFELCVQSTDPPSGGGNDCSSAIPYCDPSSTLTPDMSSITSSGTQPSCFPTAANQDVWVTFTIYQSGSIEWDAVPNDGSTEWDWALYNITSGCTGTQEVCNYNYGGSNGCDFGMDAASSTSCPTSTATGNCPPEYCPDITGNVGDTYALLLDNYTGNNTSFDFTWTGTAEIQPSAAFSISPSGVVCDDSVTVSINDSSNGNPTWTFGDGTSYTGQNPPDHTYTSPGVYAITAQVGDTAGCMDQHTEYVQLYGPLSLDDSVVQETCPGTCDGAIYLYPSGGSGQYTYSWSNGSTSPYLDSLCSGS